MMEDKLGFDMLPEVPLIGFQQVDELGLLKSFRFTDTANAELFQNLFCNSLRFNCTSKTWMYWDGCRWKADKDNSVFDYVRRLISLLHQWSFQCEDQDLRTRILKHVIYCEKYSNQINILKIAETLPKLRATISQFDNKPNLLNCRNATIEFNGGSFHVRKHSREDYLTQMTDVVYDKNARCPNWIEFLETIFNKDENIISFVQRAIGYSLTGYTSEDSLFFLFGTGANGKSTFSEILRMILGEYFAKSSYELITFSFDNSIRNDVARLHGSRFVCLSEIEGGKRLNESLVKDLTGGDMITARFLFKEFFEYKPQFKIWLYGNHKPLIRGTDTGIKRRIKLIPFEVQIPEEKRKSRDEILSVMREELSGIFLWALEGYSAWRNTGLSIPEKVRNATNDYFGEMDIYGEFIKECCKVEPEQEVSLKDLFNTFLNFLKEAGEKYQPTKRNFAERMREKNFNTITKRRIVFFIGIGLTETYIKEPEIF